METKEDFKAQLSADTDKLVDLIIESIHDKKGEEVTSLDLRTLDDAMTDVLIVTHVNTSTQLKAIADHIIKNIKDEHELLPWHREGFTNLEWVLIDYVDVVVHVFLKEKRDYYQLEELWSDAKVTVHEDLP